MGILGGILNYTHLRGVFWGVFWIIPGYNFYTHLRGVFWEGILNYTLVDELGLNGKSFEHIHTLEESSLWTQQYMALICLHIKMNEGQ